MHIAEEFRFTSLQHIYFHFHIHIVVLPVKMHFFLLFVSLFLFFLWTAKLYFIFCKPHNADAFNRFLILYAFFFCFFFCCFAILLDRQPHFSIFDVLQLFSWCLYTLSSPIDSLHSIKSHQNKVKHIKKNEELLYTNVKRWKFLLMFFKTLFHSILFHFILLFICCVCAAAAYILFLHVVCYLLTYIFYTCITFSLVMRIKCCIYIFPLLLVSPFSLLFPHINIY